MSIDIKELIKLANSLDERGFSKEADMCDDILKKEAERQDRRALKMAPPSYVIDDINKFKTTSFVYDFETGASYHKNRWSKLKLVKKFAVLLRIEGATSIFADPNHAYKLYDKQTQIVTVPAVAFKESEGCTPIDKFVLCTIAGLPVIKNEDFKTLLKGIVDSNVDGKKVPVILHMIGDGFKGLYAEKQVKGIRGDRTIDNAEVSSSGNSKYAELKSKIEDGTYVVVQRLATKNSDQCRGGSSGQSDPAREEVANGTPAGVNPPDAANQAAVANQSSSTTQVLSSNASGIVFYKDGDSISAFTHFAKQGEDKTGNLTASDKALISKVFGYNSLKDSIAKFTALNRAAETILNIGQSSQADYFETSDKIASDFYRRLMKIKKLADADGGIDTDNDIGYIVSGMKNKSGTKQSNWANRDLDTCTVTAIKQGDQKENRGSANSAEMNENAGNLLRGKLNA